MRSVAILLAFVACKGGASKLDDTGSGSGSAAPVVTTDWVPACRVTLEGLPKLGPARRVQALLDGCQPCDTSAFLRWRTLPEDGGPRLEEIERSMESCEAFCSDQARQAFYGAIDAARGKQTERPWRRLAEVCPQSGSDGRFASAPLFALDRIARAAAKDPTLAPLLAPVELPLPAWAVSGSGPQLPESAVIKPLTTRAVMTVTQTEVYIGTLAVATLGPDGVTVDLGRLPYPGDQTSTAPVLGDEPVVIIAPSGMRAVRVVDAVKTVARPDLRLAVASPGAPDGWSLLGMSGPALAPMPPATGRRIEVGASADPAVAAITKLTPDELKQPLTLVVSNDATVAELAKAIGAVGYHGVTTVHLVEAAP